MSRTLKSLGLAFLALFAISAVVASAAQATEFFHQHEERTIITAANEGVGHTGAHTIEFVTGFGAIQCTNTKLEGTEIGLEKHESPATGTTWTKESLTVTPTLSGCAFAGNPATVDTTTGKCHYKLYAATTETVAGKAHGNVEIICETGKSIDMSVPALGIVIHFPNQLIPHAVNYTNVNTNGGTNGEEITISTTAEDRVAWTCTPKALCVAGLGANSGTEATFKGLSTAKGFEDLGSAPKEKTSENIYVEGNQRGIWKGPTN